MSQPQQNDIVVLLDDDDQQPLPKQDEQMEIIDLVDEPPPNNAANKCINYACKSGGEHLVIAPSVCLSYYRVTKPSKGKKCEVCTECYALALQHYEKLSSDLRQGGKLADLSLPKRTETFEIDSSDDEEASSRTDDAENDENCIQIVDDESLELIHNNFDEILNATMAKFQIQSRHEQETDMVKERAEQLKKSIEELSSELRQTRQNLDGMQIELYNQFRVKSYVCSETSIDDDATKSSDAIINTEIVQRTYQPTKRPVVPKAPVASVPKSGDLVKPTLKIGEIYYISREYKVGNWIKAKLLAKYPPRTLRNDPMNYHCEVYRFQEVKEKIERVISGKMVALMIPSTVCFQVGQRIIAMFKEQTTNNPPTPKTRDLRKSSPFYPGIVAEAPTVDNNFRYLVFYDIGYTHYVNCIDVYQVVEPSLNVWEDMPPSCREFIQKYLENVPTSKQLPQFSVGERLKCEYNEMWWFCHVLKVDCSLILVEFIKLKRTEWIYRGSKRLNKDVNSTQRVADGRAVARKSTMTRPSQNQKVGAVQQAAATRRQQAAPTPAPNQQEPTSKIMYFTPREQTITQKVIKAHRCSPACKDYIRYGLSKLRGQNPLAKPLLSGWGRVTLKVKTRKDILYKAPCGRMLRNIHEVYKYLRMTNSEMTVDLFDFDPIVRCLAEFTVDCLPNPKDLSGGLEQCPVPVINGINNKKLDFCQYDTQRIPTDGVELNLDPEFLTGCDCTDGCWNRFKCSCWQLTLEGAKYMGKNVNVRSIGYNYRRLHEQVLTGIYECNSRCKCSSTCLNRVAQNPMSVKLQVFMTHNRDWGIRCVNDIPQGTFICIYAGTIHTDQNANMDGLEYGDEYFAELDYIENCEKFKEDYEMEAMEPEQVGNAGKRGEGDKREEKEEEEEEEEDGEDDDDEGSEGGRRRRNRKKDDDFQPSYYNLKEQQMSESTKEMMRLRKRKSDVNADKQQQQQPQQKDDVVVIEDDTITISDDEDDQKEVLNFNPKSDAESKSMKNRSVRSFFNEEEPYIMDTKNCGNIGRFLNHSCSPNVFVQNVFVDTHDLRFPWVAFFSSHFIRAGSELTWNYNYDIDSVPGKQLECRCGSLECKGRLL